MHGHYLSLDDVEEEVWVAAAAKEMSQTQRLVEAFYLFLDLRRRSTRWTPEHKQKRSPSSSHTAVGTPLWASLKIQFAKLFHLITEAFSFFCQSTSYMVHKVMPLNLLLWIQTGKLRQQQAVALCDGLFGGGCCQVALKGQDLLFLSLGDLQLPVDHLRLCVLICNGAWRVGIVTMEA